MTVVERISASNLGKADKIVKLWVVVMLNYRQPLGDAAWDEMRAVTDTETVAAIALLTGYSTAIGLSGVDQSKLEDLLNEKADW